MRRAAVLLASLCLGTLASAVPASALEPGDVLVLDRANDRVLSLDAVTGAISTLSPRSGTNLLDAPIAIATRPDGEVLVLNGAAPRLVSIDPTTGAQSDVAGGEILDLGANPGGLDVIQTDPGPEALANIYVASDGQIIEVTRSAGAATAAPFSTYPAEVTDSPVAAAIRTPTQTGPIDIYVATPSSLLWYLGNAQTTTSFSPAPAGALTGVDIAGSLFIAQLLDECPSESNGVYLYFANTMMFQPFAVGGDLSCPGAIAVNPPSSGIGAATLYAIQNGTTADSIVEAPIQASPPVTILATPTGTATPELVDLAIYVPEPASVATGLGALFALAGVARARRGDQSAA